MNKLVKRFWAQYTAFGQFFLTLAVIAICVDAVICYNYGISQTLWHGVGFALLAVVIAVLPDAAAREWEKGSWGNALAIGLACLPLAPVAYQSHLGYSAGVRVGDITQAVDTNAVHTDGRKALEQAQRDVKSAEERLKALGWLDAQVTHQGIRSEIDAKNEAVRQETKRGGCGPLCLKLRNELAELEKRLGAVEDRSKYEDMKAAAQRRLETATAKAATSKQANSVTVHQNSVAAQIWLTFAGVAPEKAIDPDKVTLSYVNTGISGANSLAFMVMAPLCWFVASRNRRRDLDDGESPSPIAPEALTPTPAADIPAKLNQVATHLAANYEPPLLGGGVQRDRKFTTLAQATQALRAA